MTRVLARAEIMAVAALNISRSFGVAGIGLFAQVIDKRAIAGVQIQANLIVHRRDRIGRHRVLGIGGHRQVYPGAREQRCWVHKTGNVLNKLPKGLQKKAKGRLQDIWMAETRKDAESAFDFFLEAYGPKYDKAAACLAKDRDVLLTFYDFPAEHWKHVRTTNPIESTFATVRLRTYRTKGCLSRKTAMAMVFKLCQCAQRKWRKLDGSNHLAEIIRGVKFVDGERQDRAAA